MRVRNKRDDKNHLQVRKRRATGRTPSEFYLVSDDSIEIVDVHGLPAQLARWLQGR